MPTTTAKHGPKGAKVDLRNVLGVTAGRLLHYCHPNQINTYAKLKTLQNQINCVPGREQKKYQQLGDCYSKRESWKLMQGVSDGFDSPIIAMQKDVQSLYLGRMQMAGTRRRKAVAMKGNIRGFAFFADNVGMVSYVEHT